MTAPVSVVVMTYNEEANVAAALESVAGWAREIFLVDSGSTDRTVEIARRYTDLVHEHPYVDHASQWGWALASLPFSCEWLLALDARLDRQAPALRLADGGRGGTAPLGPPGVVTAPAPARQPGRADGLAQEPLVPRAPLPAPLPVLPLPLPPARRLPRWPQRTG